MKRFLCGVSLGLLLAGPVSAEVWDSPEPSCNQLWYTRNLIMNRAGYCFGSALGKAFFDNSDCRGTEIKLSARESRQVAKMQAMERELGCNVNTKARDLDIHWMVDSFRDLRDLPLPGGGGSACLSWRGGTVPVFDGYTAGSKRIGAFYPGDRLDFSDIREGKWTAVTVSRDRGDGVFGWFDHIAHDVEANCTDWAG